MGIKLLANTVWRDAARLLATDTSDAALADQSKLENVSGGSRHLAYTGAGTSPLRCVYVNKAGGLRADHAVIVRADRHNGHAVKLRRWSAYPATAADLFSTTNFAQTLVGPTSQDFVFPFSEVTGQQAFCAEFDAGAGGSYAKAVHQVFFAKAVEFLHGKPPSFRKLSFPSRYFEPKTHRFYLVDEEVKIVAENVPLSTKRDFEQLPWLKEEPLVVYDAAGKDIPYFALHGVVADFACREEFHDVFTIELQLLRLRHW